MLWARRRSTGNEWRVADLSWSRICNRNFGEYGSARGESSCRLRQESSAGEVAFTTDVSVSIDPNLPQRNGSGNFNFQDFSPGFSFFRSLKIMKWVTKHYREGFGARRAVNENETEEGQLIADNEWVFFGNTRRTVACNASQMYLILSLPKHICGKSHPNCVPAFIIRLKIRNREQLCS
jgi:hypothetical protein